MDRNYYYRILGLREDASPAQIKAAYEDRMAKLNLDDYGDDPEYVHKKKQQATAAYRVLMGSAPAIGDSQRKVRFERFKDMLEDREGKDDFVESEQEEWEKRTQKKERSAKARSFAPRQFTAAPQRPKAAGKKSVKKVLIIIVIICVALTVLSGVVNLIRDAVADFPYEFYDGSDDSQYGEDMSLAMREALEGADVSKYLDTSTREAYADSIIHGEYVDGDLFDAMMEFSTCFDAYVGSGVFGYISGDSDFYWENSDEVCADLLLEWLGLPAFAEVAGCTDTLNGTPILCYTDYFNYLTAYAYQEDIALM